jgi:DNA-binding FadR family transcriptional regulator
MPLQSIEPRRLYRQVADQLRQLIDSGEYPVGSRLPTERELAASLGISRPTVREALIALEVDGRVRIRVGSGIYVLPTETPSTPATPPWAGPFEILAARALFEGTVAEQAAHRASAADIAAIDHALDGMHRVDGNSANSVAADRAFHIAVAAALGNEAITKVVGDLFDQRINPYFARLASYFETPASWRAACLEHRAIRDHIAAADANGARDAMRAHLEQSQARFSSTFGDRAPETKFRAVAQLVRPKPAHVRHDTPKAVATRRKSP